MSEETIEITLAEYQELKEDSRILGLLYAGGVDNWEWYSESIYGDEEGEDNE